MELKLIRKTFTATSTIGMLFINDQEKMFCYTLEDTVRGPGVKIPGRTAIPSGRYEVIIDFSNRFQREMPHVLNVPNFEGIRIHKGNTDKDTEGCILLGMTKSEGFIGQSKDAFNKFFPLLQDSLKEGKVYITIG